MILSGNDQVVNNAIGFTIVLPDASRFSGCKHRRNAPARLHDTHEVLPQGPCTTESSTIKCTLKIEIFYLVLDELIVVLNARICSRT